MRGSYDKDGPGHPTNSSGSLFGGVGGGGRTPAELRRDHVPGHGHSHVCSHPRGRFLSFTVMLSLAAGFALTTSLRSISLRSACALRLTSYPWDPCDGHDAPRLACQRPVPRRLGTQPRPALATRHVSSAGPGGKSHPTSPNCEK